MERYGEMFPDNPRDLEELVDSLVRRAMAAQRLLARCPQSNSATSSPR